MTDYKGLFRHIFKIPTLLLTKTRSVFNDAKDIEINQAERPIFYVLKQDSLTDLLILQRCCKKHNLPNPFKPVEIKGKSFKRYVCLDKLQPVLKKQAGKTDANDQVNELLNLHSQHPEIDAQLLPCYITWGRSPGVKTDNVQTIFSDQKKPSWLKKAFIILFSGRHTFLSISKPLSLRFVADEYGTDKSIANKLLRVARFHFQRRHLALAGPRLWQRDHLITSLLASPVIKKAIEDEAKTKNISIEQARATAKSYLEEMVADYRENFIRIMDKIFTWIWNKLYSGIEVKNDDRVRKLAQDGHEIVYVPCHRSHMDYLLLTYVIYRQGIVPPHIAAGVNLNFWPMGTVFRRSGAFFIRRSFRGNKLYSETFREYLAQLIAKGHSIKYYPESGRSRTGRLLKPKTGMLAMTVQTMLRGLDRPVTLVPVYVGYEHVMEVKTYLRELSGQKKKKESALHLFSIVKNLRHFGRSYVNFGEPINLNKSLNQDVPEWKQSIDPFYPPKPAWLPNYISNLSQKVMSNINHAAALNCVNLTAMVLSVANKHVLFRDELAKQLALCIQLHSDNSPFKDASTPPESDVETLIDNAIKMDKFDVDTSGVETIALPDESAVELSYYRNNIIHMYMIPSLVAAILLEDKHTQLEALKTKLTQIYPLLANEYFIEIDNEQFEQHLKHVLATFQQHKLINVEGENISAVDHADKSYLQLHLLSLLAQETLQRYAIVLHLVDDNSQDGLVRSDLERRALEIAKNLAKLHDIKAPEFVDKSILSQFVGELRDNDLIVIKAEGRFIGTPELHVRSSIIYSLIDGDVLSTIRHK